MYKLLLLIIIQLHVLNGQLLDDISSTVRLGNNYITYIAVIVSHDFGLPYFLQWKHILLLQLNNSLIENALKTRIRSVIVLKISIYMYNIDSINQ